MLRRKLFPLLLIVILFIFAWTLRAAAAAPTPEQLEFFEKTIRPLLAEHCYSCQSEKAEKLKGGLRLDKTAGVLKGGDSCPPIIPADAQDDLLIQRIPYSD